MQEKDSGVMVLEDKEEKEGKRRREEEKRHPTLAEER